jgi:hypothetical protein
MVRPAKLRSGRFTMGGSLHHPEGLFDQWIVPLPAPVVGLGLVNAATSPP